MPIYSESDVVKTWDIDYDGKPYDRKPRTIDPEAMAVDAMKKMEAPPSPVQFLPVINQQTILIGIVTLHGLVSAGLWFAYHILLCLFLDISIIFQFFVLL